MAYKGKRVAVIDAVGCIFEPWLFRFNQETFGGKTVEGVLNTFVAWPAVPKDTVLIRDIEAHGAVPADIAFIGTDSLAVYHLVECEVFIPEISGDKTGHIADGTYFLKVGGETEKNGIPCSEVELVSSNTRIKFEAYSFSLSDKLSSIMFNTPTTINGVEVPDDADVWQLALAPKQ